MRGIPYFFATAPGEPRRAEQIRRPGLGHHEWLHTRDGGDRPLVPGVRKPESDHRISLAEFV